VKKNGDKGEIKGDDQHGGDMNDLTQAIKKAMEEME